MTFVHKVKHTSLPITRLCIKLFFSVRISKLKLTHNYYTLLATFNAFHASSFLIARITFPSDGISISILAIDCISAL